MALNLPREHLIENEKLIADGYVDLFEIKLKNNTYLFLKNNNTVEWQGKTWQGIPLSFEGYSSSSNDSLSRHIRDGLLNRATITRYRVLYQNILNNVNIFQSQTWIVWNTPSFNNKFINFELRTTLDGPNFVVPARQYLPPEFPCVRL